MTNGTRYLGEAVGVETERSVSDGRGHLQSVVQTAAGALAARFHSNLVGELAGQLEPFPLFLFHGHFHAVSCIVSVYSTRRRRVSLTHDVRSIILSHSYAGVTLTFRKRL